MTKRPYLIGITGLSCSGKSTLAKNLCKHFKSNSLHIDIDNYIIMGAAFNCPNPSKSERNAVDGLYLGLKNLKDDLSASICPYDCHLDTFKKPHYLKPNELVVVEGHMALWSPNIRNLFDLKIFVNTPEEACLERRIDRTYAQTHDITTARESTLKRWKIISAQWNNHLLPFAKLADLVINPNDKGLEKTLEKMTKFSFHS